MSFQNDDRVSNISSRLFPFSRPQKTQFLVIAGVAVMLKTELESRKILVSDFLLQLTILTFSNHEIHSPKILNLLASVSAKISTQHDGSEHQCDLLQKHFVGLVTVQLKTSFQYLFLKIGKCLIYENSSEMTLLNGKQKNKLVVFLK